MHFKTILKSLKNKDMLKRIFIVLGILVAYRLLAHIPVPMGDAKTFKDAVSSLISKSDFTGFINLISGGGLASFSIILVGLSPYITLLSSSNFLARPFQVSKSFPRMVKLVVAKLINGPVCLPYLSPSCNPLPIFTFFTNLWSPRIPSASPRLHAIGSSLLLP